MSRRILLRDVEPGHLYSVQVRSVAGDAVSDWSQMYEVQAVTDVTAPAAPSALSWVVEGTAFKATWTGPTTNSDGSELKDFRDFEVTVFSSADPATKAVYYTTAERFDFPFEANVNALGTPRANVTIEVRSRDHTGNVGAPVSASASNPAPSAPTGLAATAAYDSIALKWNGVSDTDLKEYRVYHGTTAGTATTLVWKGLATSFIHSLSTYNTDAHYRVVAADVFNTESTAATAGPLRPVSPFSVDAVAPGVPAGLAITLNNATDGKTANAYVTWTAVVATDLAGYTVGYKPTAATDWQYVSVDHSQTSVLIDGLLPYTNYDFRIRSKDWAANLSAWSSTVNKVATSNTAPATVTGAAITAGKDSVTVSWTENTEEDVKNGNGVYLVDIATNSGFTTGLLSYRTGATNITISGLAQNQVYYARVKAVDSLGLASTSWSTSVNATTGTFPLTPLSDGSAPTSSPVPTVTGGIGYLFASWTPVANNDPVTYEVHVGTTSGFTANASSKVGEIAGSTMVIEKDGAGTALAYSTNYYVKTIAKDRDGSAAASAASTAVQLVKVAASDSSLTAGDVGAATPAYVDQAEIDAIAAAGTNADGKITNYNTNTVQPALNGKNKTVHSTSDPSGTGFIAGDTWFKYDGSNRLVGMWRHNGSIWQAQTIENALISTLDAAKINTGYLDVANRIQAGSVNASKLFIGDFTNLAADGNFTDTTKANWTGSGTVIAGTTEPNKLQVITAASGNNDQTNVNSFQVTPGEKIYGEIWVYGETTNVGAGGPNLHLTIKMDDGSVQWPQFGSSTRAAVQGVWTKLSGTVTIPANARSAKVEPAVGFSADAVGNIYYFRQASVRRMSGATLIEDGAITTNKILAGSITAASGIIADAAITSAKIVSVTANKIATGTLSAAVVTIGAGGIIQTNTGGVQITDSGIVIPSGMLDANVIKANTSFVTTINIGAGGKVQSTGYTDAGTSGFKLDNTGLVIKGTGNSVDVNALTAGTITGKIINVGTGGVLNVDATGQIKSNNWASLSTGYKLDSTGLEVNDGSINAKVIKSGTIDAATITLSGANGKIVGTGFSLSGSGLTVTSGSIEAAAVKVQAGSNMLPAEYAGFEFVPAFYTGKVYSYDGSVTYSIDTTQKKMGTQSLKMVNGGVGISQTVLGSGFSDYNIPVEGGKSYIASAWVYQESGSAQNISVGLAWNNSTGLIATTSVPSGVWTRIYGVMTAGATATAAYFDIRTASGSTVWVDAVQVEEKTGAIDTPSVWTMPGITSIDAGVIRTGELRSTSTVTVNGASQPSWSINMSGNAQFGDASVRGRVVVGPLGAGTNIAPNGGTFEADVTGYSVYSVGGTSPALARTTTAGEVITGTGSAKASGAAMNELGISMAVSPTQAERVAVRVKAKVRPLTSEVNFKIGLHDGTGFFTTRTVAEGVNLNVVVNIDEVFVIPVGKTLTNLYIYGMPGAEFSLNGIVVDDVEVLVSPDSAASYLASGNYEAGKAGWRIDSSGAAEFYSGTFRGDIVTGSAGSARWEILASKAGNNIYGYTGTLNELSPARIFTDNNYGVDGSGWAAGIEGPVVDTAGGRSPAYLAFTNRESSLGTDIKMVTSDGAIIFSANDTGVTRTMSFSSSGLQTTAMQYTLTMASGWGAYGSGYAAPRAYRQPDGAWVLTGLVKRTGVAFTTSAAGHLIATIPASAYVGDATNGKQMAPCVIPLSTNHAIQIDEAGGIWLRAVAATDQTSMAQNSYVSLSGITFHEKAN